MRQFTDLIVQTRFPDPYSARCDKVCRPIHLNGMDGGAVRGMRMSSPCT